MSKKLHKGVSASLPSFLWLMLFALLPAQLSAYEFTATGGAYGEPFIFEVLDEDRKTVSVKSYAPEYYYMPYSDLILPSTVYDGDVAYTVTEIANNSFKNKEFGTIIIPETIKKIGWAAFYKAVYHNLMILAPDCEAQKGNLSYGSFEGSEETIHRIGKITAPASIGRDMFFYDNYPYDGRGEYEGLLISFGREVKYKDGVLYDINEEKVISAYCLSGVCNLPETVTTIADYAFDSSNINLLNIEALNPPAIAYGQYPYIDLTVPSGCLMKYLTSGWQNFKVIKDASGFEATLFSDDVFNYRLINENEAAITSGKYSSMTSISIPERVVFDEKFKYVTAILSSTFKDCRNITSLTLPKNLKMVCDRAFEGCSGLTSVTFPASLNSIGENAFSDCYGLTSVYFPESLTTIGKNAFCSSMLQELNLPKSLKVISDGAFSYCSDLTDVSVNSDIESIGNSAFSECRNLKTFNHKRIASVGTYAFHQCEKLDNMIVDWEDIAEGTFYGCNSLKSLTLTTNVRTIGDMAFNSCEALTSISIPTSVTTIGYAAFAYCNRMNSITLEDGTKTIDIGGDALYKSPIKEMYIGRDYSYDFSGSISTGISALSYGNSVTSIPDNAFKNATGLKTVNFGSSIETIGENAFNGCALTELVLPPHVKTIGNNAFASNDIKNIAIGSEVTEIGEKAFAGANQLTGVSITSITPPMANNNTFSYYDCPLYVIPACVDTYYNFTRCWYRFTGHELIPADKVTIATEAGNTANITLKPGETLKLSATITPADTSLPYIFWRSTNPAFATVDHDGNVTLVLNDGISDQAYATNTCEIIAETLYADVVAKIAIKEGSAEIGDVIVDGISEKAPRSNDIYNLQGICLKRNASQEDIDALAPGLYIIAGKKVLVK